MNCGRVLFVLGLLLVAASAAAQPPTVSAGGQFLTVDGVLASGGAIVKVAGPEGYRHMQEVVPGDRASIDLLGVLRERDAAATSLPAGIYRYEVVSRPGGATVSGTFSIGVAPVAAPVADVTSRPDEPASISGFLDAIAIADDLDDGITTFDFDSDDPSLDLHWTIVNEAGYLKFKEHSLNTGNEAGEGTTNVVFARSDTGLPGIGIGTDLTLFSLDVVAESPIINLADTDGGANWKLINADGDFWLQGDCNGTCEPFERWNVVVVEDGAQEESLVIDSAGVSFSSSRAVKKNIEPAATADLLDQLAGLPIYTWSYALDSTNTPHVGPMAEDFHQRFGVGSDESRLSPMDAGGVALAAIQALRQEVLDKDSRLEAMEAKLEELTRLIAESP